ncbi:MFS general substrate transporter [Imleria badia]|nr:MFS general substrate transporter [Imleria badia]
MGEKDGQEASCNQSTKQTAIRDDLSFSGTLAISSDYEKSISPQESPATSYPEGGLRAWSVVVGAAFVSFATLGWINSFGVFQAYYQEGTVMNESTSNIAWIGSIQFGFIRVPGFFVGWLLDRGYYKGPFAISSALYILSLFLVAECKTYWQFVLCQGVANGTFAGMLFGTAPTVVSHWFHRRRSFALGVFAVGSSVGGIILPIAVHELLKIMSFQWTMRVMASILGFSIVISNLLLRTRLPSNAKGGIFKFQMFKNLAFSFCVLAYNVSFLGLYVPLSYLNLSAQVASVGRPPNYAFYLVSFANCGSLISRVASGYLADKFGPLNVLIPFTFVAGITSYIWPYVTAHAPGIIVISIIYGCATGAFVSLLPSVPIRLGRMEDAGSRVGMATTCILFGSAAGPPLAGLLHTMSGGFVDVGLYAGFVIMLGCVLLAITRRLALGQWTGNF